MLNISHTHAEGTLIDGTGRGDGTAEVLKANGWRWSRNLGTWYLPNSRDRLPAMWKLDRTASALRNAGHAVELAIDTTSRPTAEVEAEKAARAQERAEALAAKAERRDGQAAAAQARSDRADESLPPGGESIKVGHHSEYRHRRALEKAHQAMSANVQADSEATEAHRRAQVVTAATGLIVDRSVPPERLHEPDIFSARNLVDELDRRPLTSSDLSGCIGRTLDLEREADSVSRISLHQRPSWSVQLGSVRSGGG